ncbi:MAG: NTP transferase domain-containing protein [Planctomycetaceae bacterium]
MTDTVGDRFPPRNGVSTGEFASAAMKIPDCYAIVPAAGFSRRMAGRHKLLLPWDDCLVIDHVLRAWTNSRVRRVVVVVRRDDSELRDACGRWPVDVVQPPFDPPDMKASVRHAIGHILAAYQPQPADRWLMAPADIPTLSTDVIDHVIAASGATDAVVIPRFGHRSGHPASFPWKLASAVDTIPDDQGIKWLADNHAAEWLDLPAAERPEDIDTPDDYARLKRNRGKRMDDIPDTP